MTETPFRIRIPQSDLDDLHRRLADTRWPDAFDDPAWELGIPVSEVHDLVDYWRLGFDWRAQEERLNGFPQFTTALDGTNIHFLHLKSPEPDAVPLLLTHGWPGSIVEFLDLIGPLADPRAYGGDPAVAFHVVVPSVPGFAFSGPTPDRGWGPARTARAWAELMTRLGYHNFGTHGGDWGALISRELCVQFPERIIGAHVTMLPSAVAREAADIAGLSGDELAKGQRSLEKSQAFQRTGVGYAMIQSTKPQTLAYGLTDSPAGQLAWIAEKFRAFSNADHDLIDRDDLLANVSIYWFTRTAASSSRIYADQDVQWGAPLPESAVPTAVAVFPDDIGLPLRHLAERTDRIVRWTEFPRGGHFPALEEPDLVIGDLRAFFSAES
ncbi:epoxide hydrolase [Amycolatopsis rubida]|uniref:Epoxide hydrolase n=1 Tax=Amycolatopsis rubida TaxID=112413 RepID=A0A1I5EJY7_9PSEU|nr:MULTISPECIES: epoxide hydrolase family protein [Amycolatopsis]MYW97140.1 alpha/beta fold hydrolase [Amycolatopsis rubida]NEC62125.1 epoxide hydrolase [Amycolatopsis rubida]OAP27361.1 Haloalkane dehalogenase [Amycolatopsis sp. M39]SFO11819.1 epoxide hydrolase [Amycolatopsis rubida]